MLIFAAGINTNNSLKKQIMKSITHSLLKAALFSAFALTCVAPLSQVKAQTSPLVLTEVSSTILTATTLGAPTYGTMVESGPDHWIWTAPPGIRIDGPNPVAWSEPVANDGGNVLSILSSTTIQILSDNTVPGPNIFQNGVTDFSYNFIDSATGAVMHNGLAYVDQAVEVPEPSTLTLLGGTFVLLGALGRKLRE